MEVAGPLVGVLANVFMIGRELTSVYQSLANAHDEIAERIALIKSIWITTREQLETIERIWSSLSNDHQAMQAQALGMLLVKLKSTRDKLEGLLKKRKHPEQVDGEGPTVKRWKFIFVKPHLDDTFKSLQRWRKIYDPSWYLIIRVASPLIDSEMERSNNERPAEAKALRKAIVRIRSVVRHGASDAVHVSLPSDGLDNAQVDTIPCSAAKHMQRNGKNERYIIDTIPCLADSYVGEIDKDIRTLARKLHCIDPPTFGLLNCRGMMKIRGSNGRVTSFKLVFSTPSPEKPRSLRSCLILGITHTLTERIDLAKQLARSVSYVHTLDFVHKNIQPETFIGFGEGQLGSFFLIGFEQIRNADGITQYRGDIDWHKNLYRHPERQGMRIQERYSMQHDMYSMGVCLLEIGLWQSFVLYGEDGKPRSPNTALFRSTVEELRRKKPQKIKDLLVDMARNELAAVVGEMYRDVVVNCLTCLDEDNADFGDKSEFEDADGVTVGVRFIEKVLSKLNSISV